MTEGRKDTVTGIIIGVLIVLAMVGWVFWFFTWFSAGYELYGLQSEYSSLKRKYELLEVNYKQLKEKYDALIAGIERGEMIAGSASWISEDKRIKVISELIPKEYKG